MMPISIDALGLLPCHSRLLLCALAAIAIYLTWLLSSIYRSKLGGGPPRVPYLVPWLGSALSFTTDNNAFVEWIKKKLPTSPIATVVLGGRRMYIVFDHTLAAQIYRKPNTYAFDPFILLTAQVFGNSAQDIKVFADGMPHLKPDVEKVAATVPGSRYRPGVIQKIHHLTVSSLRGPSLDRMTSVFNEHIFDSVDEQFPPAAESSYEWREIDLVEFAKRTWTLSSVVALFGTELLKTWPRFYEWFWDFDTNILPLFARLPQFMIPKSYALREEGIDKLQQWEMNARKAYEDGKIRGDPEWDPYWGLRYMKQKTMLAEEAGVNLRGRIAMQLALIWGQNANAVPVAIWALIYALHTPDLLAKLQSEFSQSLTDPIPGSDLVHPTISMSDLHSGRHLKSLVLECYRWATASPNVRVLQNDTTLGGYKLKKGSMMYIHTRSMQMDKNVWKMSKPGCPFIDSADFQADRFLDADEKSYEEARAAEVLHAESNYKTESEVPKEKEPEAPTTPNLEKGEHKFMKDLFSLPQDKEAQTRMQSLRTFGGGQTMCPGRHFATNEILSGLAVLLTKLEFKIDEDALARRGFPKCGMEKQGGLLPDRPFTVQVRRRRPAV